MTRDVPNQYFENRKQQAEIKFALTAAVPEGVYYHNLIIALAEMLTRAVEQAYHDEVFTKHVDTPTPPEAPHD